MVKKIVFDDIVLLNKEQIDNLQSIINDLSSTQLAWISGYLWKQTNNNQLLNINDP